MAEKIMTPSITAGQIGKIQEILGAGLRKSGLSSKSIQLIIETQGDVLVAELVSVVRKRVETISNIIVHRVRVDRTRTPQQVLGATGRRQYANPNVVANMPGRGDGIEELDVCFFPLHRFASDDEVEETYKLHGLERLADSYALAQVNVDDPSFADTHPNVTHWKDANGNWCYAAFGRWGGERSVDVDRNALGWNAHWWFAALRK